MPLVELIAWVVVLVASIVGIATKDWRWLAATLGCAVLALVLTIVHAWR